MIEPNSLDKLVALRILIEALLLNVMPGPPEDMTEPAIAWEYMLMPGQAKEMVGLSSGSR